MERVSTRMFLFFYRFFAVHGVEPEPAVFLGQGLERVDEDGPVLARHVETEALLDRLGHAARARLDLHRLRRSLAPTKSNH